MNHIEEHKPEFEKSIESLKNQLARLRTGRANVDLVEGIVVEAYGVNTPLRQLAGISVPDSKTITIQPWDKGVIQSIEKAICASDIGINPVSGGGVIRLNVPSLTEERRKEVVSVLHHKLETARIAVRNLRDDIRKGIIEMEKNKEMTEDDKYAALENLDKTVEGYVGEIKEMGERKEKEIMTL